MLTKKQKNLLLFINKKIRSTGISPSYEEMKDSLNLKSKSGIHRLISALEERGFVKRLAHKARALEVIKLPENASANDIFNSFTPSVIYLMMLGYVFGGWMMIKTASKSVDLKNKNEMDEEFLNAKISSSMIYFSSVLPKIESLSSIILQGDEDVLAMKKNWL